MMTFMKARFAQQYREQARKQARDTSWSKARAGYVTGGRMFGYDNVAITKGQKKLAVNPAEAAIVRDIYARFAAGEGLRTIAKSLNIKGAPSPRAQQGRPSGWSMSTVRSILERPIYRGILRFGVSKKAYGRELGRGATSEKGMIVRPEEEWLVQQLPEARIIDPDLEQRVDFIRKDRMRRYKESSAQGRAPQKAHGKYLLSGGMLICPTCGGHFEARKAPWKGNPGDVYICSTRRRKPGLCTNGLALPIARADNMLLAAIEGELLNTRTVEELLALVVDAPDETGAPTRGADPSDDGDQAAGRLHRRGCSRQVRRRSHREKESELSRVETKLRAPRQATDRDRLRDALLQKVETWRADLRKEPKIARLVLRRLVGPFTLWTEAEEEYFRNDRPGWSVRPSPDRPRCWMISSPSWVRPQGGFRMSGMWIYTGFSGIRRWQGAKVPESPSERQHFAGPPGVLICWHSAQKSWATGSPRIHTRAFPRRVGTLQ